MTFFVGQPERLERFRSGDREVLTEVYRFYVGPLQNVLRQGFSVNVEDRVLHIPGLNEPTDVETACQEVFLRAFRASARAGYDGERSYANYLYRIARNWRIDTFRRHRRERPIDDAQVAELEDPSPSAQEQLVDHELERLIQAYLETVPERDRSYFLGRLAEGRSQTEAAGVLGMTRIQGRRIEARVKTGLLAWLRARGYSSPASADAGEESP
jgi:RNA polymerase sigma factor (sigma-70 family)